MNPLIVHLFDRPAVKSSWSRCGRYRYQGDETRATYWSEQITCYYCGVAYRRDCRADALVARSETDAT